MKLITIYFQDPNVMLTPSSVFVAQLNSVTSFTSYDGGFDLDSQASDLKWR